MKYETVRILNGTLEIPQTIRTSMKLQDGMTLLLEQNEDGTLTVRKKDTTAAMKEFEDKHVSTEIRVNGYYNLQFDTLPKTGEKR